MNPRLGYVLCCEEQAPARLVEQMRWAEEHGFSFAFVSDHFHPWNERQGHSPFVWSLLGALAGATRTIRIGTAVTCPLFRLHPVTVAQAAATTACLMEGRFFLGLGTGENLNEQVLGKPWPRFSQRLAMLGEAITIIRQLFDGRECSFEGTHFQMRRARLYDLPPTPIPILMAASGPRAATAAGQWGDGLIAMDPEVLAPYKSAASPPGTTYAQLSVCWAPTEEEGVATAHRLWPEMALEGTLFACLQTPADLARACAAITAEDVGAAVVCGPDPEAHARAVRALLEAGFEGVAVHQIGPRQQEFMRFYDREVSPRL